MATSTYPLGAWRRREGYWSRLRVAVALAGIALLVVSGWHYWTLVASLREVRAELSAVQATVSLIDQDVSPEVLASMEARTTRADRSLAVARTHFRWDPLLQLGSALPVIGTQIDATGQLMEMAALGVEISRETSAAGREVVAVRDAAESDRAVADALEQTIVRTQPNVQRIDQLVAELVERRLEMGDSSLLPPLAAARDRLDGDLPELSMAMGQLREAYAVTPGLLGFRQDRRYLVLALNNGELLPGGGLVSAAGVVTVSNGHIGEIELSDSTRWKSEWDAKGGSYIQPPGPLQRYLLRDYTWNLLVSNWDPNFPTWSQQALEFYELVNGDQDVDGVIALDLEVLRRLLTITGPRTLEAQGYGAVTFTAENAILELERLTRQSYDVSEDRKSVIGDLARRLLADIEETPSERWGELINVVSSLGAERHLQVLSFDPPEQALLQSFGWAGQLSDTDTDYVHFSEASVNSTKLNLIIQPEGDYAVDLNALGDASHHLALHYTNRLPEWQHGKDPNLVRQLMLSGSYGGYLRIFGPDSMTRFTVAEGGEPAGVEDTGEASGFRWFGLFMALPSGASANPEFRWLVPLATKAPNAREYSLRIQKQAGTAGMCLNLAVTREGLPPSSIEIRGGSRDAAGRVCLTTDVTVRALWE